MEIAMWGQNLARTRFPAMVCNGGHQSGQSAAARNDEYWICSIPTVWPAHEGHSWWWPSWYWMSMVVCFVWWAFRFWQYLESNKTYFHRCHPSLLIGAYKCTQGANFRFTIMIIDQVSRYICIRHIATLPLPGWSLARTALTVGLRAPPGQSLSLPMFKGLKTKPGNCEERQFFFKLVRESLKFVSLTALENRTEMMKIGCTRGGRWLTRKGLHSSGWKPLVGKLSTCSQIPPETSWPQELSKSHLKVNWQWRIGDHGFWDIPRNMRLCPVVAAEKRFFFQLLLTTSINQLHCVDCNPSL